MNNFVKMHFAHLVSTMETASLRTDSPNTSMLSVGSTSKAWNIASVATGSTADMRLPNVKLKTNAYTYKIC